MTTRRTAGLFVHHAGHLDERGGGVQLCSREYAATLQAAGCDLTFVAIPTDRRLAARVRRRLWDDPYRTWIDLPHAVDAASSRAGPETRFVFLNQHSLGELAAPLRARLGARCRIVVLSHGLESVDYLHALRTPGGPPRSDTGPARATMLGLRLIREAQHAREVDHVFCLAEFEREIEHWLGSHAVTVLPRIVAGKPLDWQPTRGRLGYVGTLDHVPNREGLLLFLDALQKLQPLAAPVEVRVVGGPRREGESLARRYPVVRYLGPLADDALEAEARTWQCVLHPLFCYARGASTKLAVAIGWRIPIVTTTVGHRGYTWREGALPVADDPHGFAELAARMADAGTAAAAREQVARVADSSPTIADVAAIAGRALGLR